MSDKNVKISVDGTELSVLANKTIMEACKDIGIDTPVICYHEATSSEGLCRQCVVEIDGWRVLAPACVTMVSEGMIIFTESERVVRARRTILEMLNASIDLTEAPMILDQMEYYSANKERFPEAKARKFDVFDDNPFYVRDYNKCILCWRCAQACGNDMQFTYALSIGGRGYNSNIATFYDQPMPETTCVFCGNCVAVCPSNALQSKTEFFMQQGMDYDQIRLEKRKNRSR